MTTHGSPWLRSLLKHSITGMRCATAVWHFGFIIILPCFSRAIDDRSGCSWQAAAAREFSATAKLKDRARGRGHGSAMTVDPW